MSIEDARAKQLWHQQKLRQMSSEWKIRIEPWSAEKMEELLELVYPTSYKRKLKIKELETFIEEYGDEYTPEQVSGVAESMNLHRFEVEDGLKALGFRSKVVRRENRVMRRWVREVVNK